MLTWDEVSQVLNESTGSNPEDLVRLTADYIPQGIVDQLMGEIARHYVRTVRSPEAATILTSSYMMGFHHAWFIALKAIRHET